MFEIVPSEATITHCKWELIQALWSLILNTPGFTAAYEFGILICFADNIIRHMFPQFFAYIMDYPEKQVYFSLQNILYFIDLFMKGTYGLNMESRELPMSSL